MAKKKYAINEIIGKLFQELRIQHNYTQQTVATAINMSRENYNSIENGHLQISSATLQRLCDIYGYHIQVRLVKKK